MVKRQGKVNKLVIMIMGIVRNIHSEKKGEHAHDYVYDENGKLIYRTKRPLTESERKENADIL